jgi:hypothetical protein
MISRHSSGFMPVEQRDEDHGVDRHRLARAGGAGDEQVRHAGEVGDHRLAADRLAEAERELLLGPSKSCRGHELAEEDRLALGRLGSSMPIAFLPCTTATRADTALIERAMSSAREITRDDFDARSRLELVQRHDWAGPNVG